MIARRIEAEGATLSVVESGRAEAPALALISGATTNLRMWEPLLPRLEPRFRVIRHDVRGTGSSSPSREEGDYEITRYADDVARILDGLGLRRTIVVGMAFGARVALQVAVRHPQLVELLALLDATVFAPAGIEAQKAGRREAKRLRGEAGVGEITPDRGWFEQDDPAAARKAFSAALAQPDQSGVLSLVRSPTLIATGRQDRNLEASRMMAERIPDAELHAIEMCGHGSVLQRPDVVGDLLLDFIDRRHLAE